MGDRLSGSPPDRASTSHPTPPPTTAQALIETIHGVEVRDPYRWLEDAGDPAVQAWVEAQNAYTRSVLDSLPGRPSVAARIQEALDVGLLGPSVPRGRRRFFTHRRRGMVQAALAVAET